MNNLNDLISNFHKNLDKITADFNERFKGLHELIQQNNKWEDEWAYALSTHGWYISANISVESVFRIFRSLEEGEIRTVENILINYYRKNIIDIKNSFLNRYPERKELINEAFKAHKNKMYFSSTILFLSQADGICDGKIFTRHKQNYLSNNKNPQIVEAVLTKKSAIDIHSTNKSNYFSELNRHEVMHGLYNDYGKEINSLKALSLFCFISDFVGRYK